MSSCRSSPLVGRRALGSLGWLLETLGYAVSQSWDSGHSWLLGPTYLVLEQSPALSADRYDRCRPGLNHLAFHVEDAATVERLAVAAAVVVALLVLLARILPLRIVLLLLVRVAVAALVHAEVSLWTPP